MPKATTAEKTAIVKTRTREQRKQAKMAQDMLLGTLLGILAYILANRSSKRFTFMGRSWRIDVPIAVVAAMFGGRIGRTAGIVVAALRTTPWLVEKLAGSQIGKSLGLKPSAEVVLSEQVKERARNMGTTKDPNKLPNVSEPAIPGLDAPPVPVPVPTGSGSDADAAAAALDWLSTQGPDLVEAGLDAIMGAANAANDDTADSLSVDPLDA